MIKLVSVVVLLAACSQAKEVCYPNGIGCFTDDAPWDNMPLPSDPTDKMPSYYVIQRGKGLRQIDSPAGLKFDDMLVMTHGWGGSYNNTARWGARIHDRILEVRPTADILYIDWEQLADYGKGLRGVYHQPASNVRVISQIVALWLKQAPEFNPSKVHCIGYDVISRLTEHDLTYLFLFSNSFSLGAHVCGMLAKRLGAPWARLSAIDPAGPAFIKDDITARVDKSDGLFVDVLHSSWISPKRQLGHVDFYVNNANVQPGCIAKRKKRSVEALLEKELYAAENDRAGLGDLFGLIGNVFGCSHYRGAFLYAETILPAGQNNCTWTFCPCQSKAHFDKGYCRKCDPSVSQLLGYRSFENKQRTGSFYGVTTDTEPWCVQKNN